MIGIQKKPLGQGSYKIFQTAMSACLLLSNISERNGFEYLAEERAGLCFAVGRVHTDGLRETAVFNKGNRCQYDVNIRPVSYYASFIKSSTG